MRRDARVVTTLPRVNDTYHPEIMLSLAGRRAGEAQQIDRIMEKFAERYCRDCPGAFGSADGAYLLSFAIIMLNTDAHNPMADAHMSRDDFVMRPSRRSVTHTRYLRCARASR